MGTVQSILSLLLMFAVFSGLIFLSRRAARPRHTHSHRPGARRPGGPSGPGSTFRYTTLGYAFSFTCGTALLLVSGLTGYRLDKRARFFASEHWSGEYLWGQIWMGLVLACVAAWFWRKGLREIRSNVYVPELAGRDSTTAPPSRRIERP